MPRSSHPERHNVSRIGWLRAAVLGANDGIVSTASLIVGVAAAGAGRPEILIAGVAALAAGAMSMAAGEYVSVSSQSDTEKADLAREKKELAEEPEQERQELLEIYVARGLSPGLARQVADELTAGDALAAHSRDELGISESFSARPLQAAVASALTFAAGAAAPLLVVPLVAVPAIVTIIPIVSVAALVLLGLLGAKGGGRAGRPLGDAGRLLGRARHGGDGPDRKAVRHDAGLTRRSTAMDPIGGGRSFIPKAEGERPWPPATTSRSIWK